MRAPENAIPIAFNFDIASLAPVAEACIVRIVKAVAVAMKVNVIAHILIVEKKGHSRVGNIIFNSLATWITKNLRRGVTKKRPKKEQMIVMVKILPMSCLGLSLNKSSLYIAGRPATKMPAIPPAPVAAAWTMTFSWGPKDPPRIGTPGVHLENDLMIP